MPKLIPSLRVIRRTLECEIAYTVSRMAVLERIPGNPVGIEYPPPRGRRRGADGAASAGARLQQRGRAARRARAAYRAADRLVSRRRRQGAVRDGARLLRPGARPRAGAARLLPVGLPHLAGVRARPGAAGRARAASPSSASRAPRRWRSSSTPTSPAGASRRERSSRPTCAPGSASPAGSSIWGAREGRPAAAAILFVHDKVGYCADATTDPAFRGRGLQTALLARRIADARAAGVDFVCSGAEFLSQSHRNMERVGMRVQFVRSLWTAL